MAEGGGGGRWRRAVKAAHGPYEEEIDTGERTATYEADDAGARRHGGRRAQTQTAGADAH